MEEFSLKQALELAADIEYAGFSTSGFRASLAGRWTPSDVARALTIYTMMGNNPFQQKRTDKAVKPDVAKAQAEWLSSMGVKSSAGRGSPITLGRLAKAFAPALVSLRYQMRAKLITQIPTTSPIEECDIAFLGYDSTARCRNSRPYVEAFGIIITKVTFKSMSEDEIRRRNDNFAKIARDGLQRDALLLKLLNAPAIDLDFLGIIKELMGLPRVAITVAATGGGGGDDKDSKAKPAVPKRSGET